MEESLVLSSNIFEEKIFKNFNLNVKNINEKIKKTVGKCTNFHHLTFWVSNAKQYAIHFCVHYGFQPFAYAGLETGSREYAKHVVKQNKIILQFVSPLNGIEKKVNFHIMRHGDGVQDIAFEVDDIEKIMLYSRQKGGLILQDIWLEKDDFGYVKMAKIKAFEDTCHTFIELKNYKGEFLPGYRKPLNKLKILDKLPNVNLTFIDHCVAAQLDNEMKSVAKWYEDNLNFHRFWSVDDVNIITEFSALRFIVVANEDETIKLNILEAAEGKKKSQVHEYLNYFDGPGVQHIAFHTDNIIEAIESLEERGVEFLNTPSAYYEKLNERLKNSKVVIKENLNKLKKHKILLDFDDNGYLLQIFTKPLQDRPTVFLEIIQRNNHNGFGAGNFKALFEAVEMEQSLRGNLN